MHKYILLLFSLFFLFVSCESDNLTSENEEDVEVREILYPKTGNFYLTQTGESLIVADPIIYDVIVVNHNPADEWAEYCLRGLDNEAIKNILFNAVYQGRLIPYHYRLDTPLTLEEVKEIEAETIDDEFAKLQFEEQWFFDEENLEMYKKVVSIVFGYSMRNEKGEVYGYSPGFKVYLEPEKNIITKQ